MLGGMINNLEKMMIKKHYFWALGLCVLAFPACDGVGRVVDSMEGYEIPGTGAGTTAEMMLGDDCPQIEIVTELAAFHDFADPQSMKASDLVSLVEISQAQSACEYTAKSVTVDLKVTFDGMLGPKGRLHDSDRPFFSYPFFVAVTSPGGQILVKEVFGASLTYDAGQNRHAYYENLRQIVPVKSRGDGSRHKVLVGFQLTPEQLAYNREMIKLQKAADAAEAKAQKAAEESNRTLIAPENAGSVEKTSPPSGQSQDSAPMTLTPP